MPIKDKAKEKERLRKYYENNKQLAKDRANKWYKENKERVLSQHKEKSDILKENSKKWRQKNKGKIKEYKVSTKDKRIVQQRKDRKRSIESLKDWYVVHIISKSTKVPKILIRNQPNILEQYKEQIKIKRKLKEFSKKIKK